MASTKSLLNRKAKLLRHMSADLAGWQLDRLPWFVQDPKALPPDESGLEDSRLEFWSLPQPAPATLGDAVHVTPWRFASQFVSEFERWQRATLRWERLFGPERRPRHWGSVANQCNAIASAVAGDRNFQGALIGHRSARLLSYGSDWNGGTTEGLFEGIMSAQRLADLLEYCRSANSRGDFLDWLSMDLARSTSADGRLSNLRPSVADDVEWHLCKYRASFLEARCLETESAQNSPTRLLLERNRTMTLTQIIEPLIRDLEIETNPELLAILDTVGNLINDMGFVGLYENLTSPDFSSLPSAGSDRSRINVIPGRGNAACAKVVLALFKVADSRKPALQFSRIMSALRTHLVECQQITRTAVVLADWWDGESFADYAAELSAWRRRGVQFLFLIVSEPRSTISPLRIRL